MISKLHRYDHIDSLRAIAALIVVWFHSEGSRLVDRKSSVYNLVIHYVDPGRIAVFIFFIISGFVVPITLFRLHNSDWKVFIVRRFFRLYPIYWISIILVILSWPLFHDAPPDTLRVLANISMFQSFIGYDNLLELYWTLGVEIKFYLLCLFLLRIDYLKHEATFPIIGFIFIVFTQLYIFLSNELVDASNGIVVNDYILWVGALLIKDPRNPWVSNVFLCSMGLAVMCIGASTRLIYETGKEGIKSIVLGVILSGSYTLIYGIMPVIHYFNRDYSLDELRTYLSHSLPLLLFLFFAFIGRIRHPIIVGLGTISYSIYLLHPIIMRVTYLIIRQSNEASSISLSGAEYCMYVVTLTLIFSLITYNLIERPARDMGNSIASSLSQ